MQNKVRPKSVSDTTLLNFMLSYRVDCNVSDYDRGIFRARSGSDIVYGNSARDALRGLYILYNGAG